MIEPTRKTELEDQGWTFRFVADEPRLSETVASYEALGMEVLLDPVRVDSEECTACLASCFDRCKAIYTRPGDHPKRDPCD